MNEENFCLNGNKINSDNNNFASIVYSWKQVNVIVDVPVPEKSKLRIWKPKVFKKCSILSDATGVAYPGELLAILGSSGSGKTSLLNALSFKKFPKIKNFGAQYINGVLATSEKFYEVAAYIPQQQLFIRCLTVWEHLIFQALLRLDLPYEKQKQKVEETIFELSLNRCKNTPIRYISGGEKKRLGLATEMITNPKLLVCDEPTSGLDASMALTVLQSLKHMALEGKTVICTIHQPSSQLYMMFDKILLLAEGKTAFLGTGSEAESFFKNLGIACPKYYNPADFFLQQLSVLPNRESREKIDLICQSYQSVDSVDNLKFNDGEKIMKTSSKYSTSWWCQFRAILWRSLLKTIKEAELLRVRAVYVVISALIVGATFLRQKLTQDGIMNINGAIITFVLQISFQGQVTLIQDFCTEVEVFLHEHRIKMYRIDSYFVAKAIADGPLCILIPLIYLSICYLLIELSFDRFWVAWGILILIAHSTLSFSYLLCSICTNVRLILALSFIVYVPFTLFGGFYLNINSIPNYLRWLSDLSWFKHGFASMMVNQWYNVTDIECSVNRTVCIRDGQTVLDLYGLKQDNLISYITLLAITAIFYRFLAFLSLLLKTYQR